MGSSANWTPEQIHEYMNVVSSDELDIVITLKDGTAIQGIAYSGNSETDPNGKSRASWSCTYFKEDETVKMFALDPEDIASITCGGTELIG